LIRENHVQFGKKLPPILIGLIAGAIVFESVFWLTIFKLKETARNDAAEASKCTAIVNKVDSISRLALDAVGQCAVPATVQDPADIDKIVEKLKLEFQALRKLTQDNQQRGALVDIGESTAMQHVRAAISLFKAPHPTTPHQAHIVDPFYAQIQNHELAVVADELKELKKVSSSLVESLRQKQAQTQQDINNIQIVCMCFKAFALLLFVILYAKKLTDRLNWITVVLVLQLIGFAALLHNLQQQSDTEENKTIQAVKAANAIKEIRAYFKDISIAIEQNELTHGKVNAPGVRAENVIHPLYEDAECDMIGRFVDKRHLLSFHYQLLKELKKDDADELATIVSSNEAADHVFSMLENMYHILQAEIPKMQARPIEFSPSRQAGWRKVQAGIKDILSINFLSILDEETGKTTNSPKLQELLRQQIDAVLIAECLIIFACLSFIAYTVRSVTKRVNVMNDNAIRLASNLPLNPRVSGNDEISDLDKTFHAMADSLKEASQKERAIVQNASDVICSIDARGHFSAVNPASLPVFGYTPDEMFGKIFVDFIFTDDKRNVVDAVEKLKNSAESEPIEARMIKKDGMLIDTLWSATWSPSEKALFCVIHDITERKEAERMKQEVVAMITHDLRTPLSTIRNFHEMLATGLLGELTEKANKMLALADRNASRMLSLINDLLDVEKIKAGMMELEKDDVSASKVLEQTAQSLSPLAAESGISIVCAQRTVRSTPSTHGNVRSTPCVDLSGSEDDHSSSKKTDDDDLIFHVDEDKISRVVTNLVSNAIKFSPRDSSITLGAESINGKVLISIQDQGRGIPQDKLANIFDRFQQVTAQDHSKSGGSGLGLAICKAIVELHGGEISVESEEGKGSTFKFSIPKKSG